MVRFHHVNLGVPAELVDSEIAFLTDVLRYRRLEPGESLRALGARWFETDDGSQVHLSVDPDHRPAAKAHVAIEFGPELSALEERLSGAAIAFDVGEPPGFPRTVFCQDPAGNRWELRGTDSQAGR